MSEDISKWLFWKVNREKYINIVMQKSYSTTSCSVISLLFTTMTPAHSTFCSVKPGVQYITVLETSQEQKGRVDEIPSVCMSDYFLSDIPVKKWEGLNYCSYVQVCLYELELMTRINYYMALFISHPLLAWDRL